MMSEAMTEFEEMLANYRKRQKQAKERSSRLKKLGEIISPGDRKIEIRRRNDD